MTQFLFTERLLLGTGMKEKGIYGLFCSLLSTSAHIPGIRSTIVDKAHPTPLGSSHSSLAAHTQILPALRSLRSLTPVRLKEVHPEPLIPSPSSLLSSGTATALCS